MGDGRFIAFRILIFFIGIIVNIGDAFYSQAFDCSKMGNNYAIKACENSIHGISLPMIIISCIIGVGLIVFGLVRKDKHEIPNRRNVEE